MTASAWAFLAVALALWPAADGVDRRPPGLQQRPAAPAAGRHGWLAGAGVGMACVVFGGGVGSGGVGTGSGVGGAVAAAVLGPLTAWALRRAGRAAAHPPDPALPLVLDLAAAALRSGRTLPDALDAALPAAGDQLRAGLQPVAGLLRLGAEPARAWSAVPAASPLATVAAAAVRSASSGLRIAATFERVAGELRDEAASRGAARAQRAGVTVLAPLGACFLPAFVCLGIVPVIAGLAASSFGGLG